VKITTIVPARGGSKGIPRKNLMDFCSSPLIKWSISQASASKLASNVFVSSDDEEILTYAKLVGATPIRRPDRLATDTAGIEGVMEHAIPEMGYPDVIVHLQPTSPVRSSEDIDGAVQTLLDGGFDTVFSSTIMHDICLWRDEPEGLNSFTFDYKNRGRRQDRKPLYLENGSIYVFKKENLARFSGRLGGKMGMYNMPMWKSFEIDSPEDVPICEFFMMKLEKERSCKG
jgi:CMP-N,N'-diacetyllegionaminic acid synthase